MINQPPTTDMVYRSILFSIDAGVARLTFNRPDRLNAFSEQMHTEVRDALERSKHEARVLLLTGAGRAFCAGQDLGERDMDAAVFDLGRTVETFYNPLVRAITGLPLPVVCAVNGVAAGAGVSIALACDIVIACKSARFVQAFAAIGLSPDAGGTWSLPRHVGLARALGYAITGTPISACEAAEWGMIWQAVEDENFTAEVETLVANLARAPTKSIGIVKAAIRESFACSLEQQLLTERDAQRLCGQTADYREGVRAFKAKRPPMFQGR